MCDFCVDCNSTVYEHLWLNGIKQECREHKFFIEKSVEAIFIEVGLLN